MNRKIVFGLAEGKAKTAKLLGGKGYGLAMMADLGIPVPPALTIGTTVSRSFRQYGVLPQRLATQLHVGLKKLEEQTGKGFGSIDNPLLVSVRSGAQVSMPGMMDTILNLGMTPDITKGLAEKVGKAVAYDWYKRFLMMFGSTVFDIPMKDMEVTGSDMELVCDSIRNVFKEKTGQEFPDDPMMQLSLAIIAVLRSWNSDRAKLYRKEYNIPDWLGTAVNIQAMVMGNLDERSGTGVVFSRNVATGEPVMYGEWLTKAQGEDIVAGIRTPMPISEMARWDLAIYRQLEFFVSKLEQSLNDVVDIEFTVESGRLFILQVRSAKRTPEAALTIATHFVWEKRWVKEDAVKRGRKFAQGVMRPSFTEEGIKGADLLGKGLPASPGCAVGQAVFSVEQANDAVSEGYKPILIRKDTSPDDLEGMLASVAIVTATGGLTSHAAVVARGLAVPAIVGVEELYVYDDYARLGGVRIDLQETISVDGSTGRVYMGAVSRGDAGSAKKEINIFLKWMKELEPPAPAPRIDFMWMSKVTHENTLLNEFYLSDAMYQASMDTPMADVYAEHRNEVHYRTAEHLACYLAVALAGELRHSWNKVSTGGSSPAGCGCPMCQVKHGRVKQVDVDNAGEYARMELQDRFGVKHGGDRGVAQTKVLDGLSKMDLKGQIHFFQMAADVFEHLKWEGGYGGKNWVGIAKAPIKFLTGELNHTLFADHVFDLEHNNGSVFGKHVMFSGNRDRVKRQLNEKKKANGGVRDLQQRLAALASIPAPTLELYNKGIKSRLW